MLAAEEDGKKGAKMSFKTADEHWSHIETLQKPPSGEPKSREEMMTSFKAWISKQKQAADSFLEAFPDDKRRWDAKLVSVRAAVQIGQMEGTAEVADADRKAIEEIIAATDASEETKGEAAFLRVMMMTGDFDEAKPETFSAFHKAAGEFLEKHGTHKLAGQLRQIQLQVLSGIDSPENDALLEKLAAGSDGESAGEAKTILEQRKRMAALKTKPIELKFTATNGTEVDLTKMRGKVVLVDFWASWCGPCIGEMPNVVAAYKKLHDKGFEIVGISLDQDKAPMEAAMKKLNMTWPQHFDGKGWQNEISSSFGINSIPAAWLIDKKGMLRETGLRGEALGAGVEKLLAEQ